MPSSIRRPALPCTRIALSSVLLVLAVALVACGGAKSSKSALPARTYSEKNVWQANNDTRIQAQRACFSDTVTPACFEQQMARQGASDDARSFYHDNEALLVGFLATGGPIDVGLAEVPFRNAGSELLLLNGTPPFQVLTEVLGKPPERIFSGNATYADLEAALKAGPESRNPQPSALVFSPDDVRLESVSKPGSKLEELVFQFGLHDNCHACGVGVAARIALDFQKDAKLKTSKVVGFCQGREVTRDIFGKPATFHDFSGLSAGATITEPYLLTLPDLKDCPAEMKIGS